MVGRLLPSLAPELEAVDLEARPELVDELIAGEVHSPPPNAKATRFRNTIDAGPAVFPAIVRAVLAYEEDLTAAALLVPKSLGRLSLRYRARSYSDLVMMIVRKLPLQDPQLLARRRRFLRVRLNARCA